MKKNVTYEWDWDNPAFIGMHHKALIENAFYDKYVKPLKIENKALREQNDSIEYIKKDFNDSLVEIGKLLDLHQIAGKPRQFKTFTAKDVVDAVKELFSDHYSPDFLEYQTSR